jgi:hypothetical protein
VLIEEDDSGKWFGTGFGMSVDGKEVIYVSQAETDESYSSALDSASEWAKHNGVTLIYVRRIQNG